MNKLKCGLLAVFGALALTACGDDVTKVYEDAEFATVSSLKEVECTKDNEGTIVFSKEDKGMYTCADGEWTSVVGSVDSLPQLRCETKTLKDSSGIAVYCNGDSVGVVKNGKAGAAGKVGAEGTSCTIDAATADSVWIACGKEKTAIALPGAGAKTYSRPIALNVPAPFFLNTAEDRAPVVKVTVIALDDKLEPNGKTFINEMLFDSEAEKEAHYEYYAYAEGTPYLTVGGNIKANLENPYALVRVELGTFGNLDMYSSSNEWIDNYFRNGVIYYALADMSDESTLSVTFFSDFKVQRVQKLVAGGMAVDKAMKQADEELYKAFGMEYKGEIESLWAKKPGDYEITHAFELIGTLNAYGIEIFNSAKFVFEAKKNFASSGNLNTPISCSDMGSKCEYMPNKKMLFVDAFLEAESNPHFTYSRREFAFVYEMMEQEYKLPPCKEIIKDTMMQTSVSAGFCAENFFACAFDEEYWYRISSEHYMQNPEDYFGTCSEDNLWEEVHTYDYLARCENNRSYQWKGYGPGFLEYYVGFCNSDNEGKFAEYSDYYVCENHVWKEIDYITFSMGLICDENVKHDTVYIMPGSSSPFICIEIDGDYQWSYVNGPMEYADIVYGECTEQRNGEIDTISIPGLSDMYVGCNGFYWEMMDVPMYCNAENYQKTIKVTEKDEAFVPYNYYLKCVRDEDLSSSSESPVYAYNWTDAEEIDVVVGYPCTSVKTGFDKNSPYYTLNGRRFLCGMETGDWAPDVNYSSFFSTACSSYMNPATGKGYEEDDELTLGDETYVCTSSDRWESAN